MTFLRAHNGQIWGTVQQRASVKKAAEASAAKRRKYTTADTISGGRLKAAAPTRAQQLTQAVRGRRRLDDVSPSPRTGTPTKSATPGGGFKLSPRDALARKGYTYDDEAIRKRDYLGRR